jgi:N-acyl homoserine lactone hydrolase
MRQNPDYSIWSFRYASGRMPKDFMGGCLVCSNQGTAEIPMVYSLIVSSPLSERRRVILVDTGFKSGKSMSGRNFEGFEDPRVVLEKVDLRPEDVDTVVLTHLHFDHAGNFDAFSNARVVVQRREYERWKETIDALPDRNVGKEHWAMSSMDVDVMDRVAAAVDQGKVELVDGDIEIAPGVHCRLAADTHTFGSQWVEVETLSGPYVVAGDCVYWYINIERMWPPGYIQGNAWSLMHTMEKLRILVGPQRLERIVPGHDPEIFTRHRSWLSGLNPVAEVHLAAGERSRLHS